LSKVVHTRRTGLHSANLPGPLDSFVGRKWELGELKQLLGRCRLLTLLGPIGVGKTRLAVELASRHGTCVDGTTYVDLGSLTGPELLAPAVAAALGIHEQPGEPVADTIAAALSDRRVLVLLDGCEHIIEECARLSDTLLRRCPGVRVLATSQESLRVSGEVTFAVGPLSLPDPGGAGMASEAPGSDAVRLFVDRAREQVPGFELTAANAAAVADICVRLDGMALAVELAARWVRLLPVEELLARLDDRFTLLTVAPRTAAGRHRGLRAAIDWSTHLLEAREEAVFRRLSVFDGGFDLAGATAVCADDDIPHSAVLTAMSGLEAKSVVAPAGERRRSARFSQLESIRLYGLERLHAAGESEAVHDRLATWLARLVESLPERVFASADTLRRLDDERGNLLRAAAWTAGRCDDRHAPIAVAAARCTWERGDTSEACALLRSVLDHAHTSPRHRSSALQQAAWLDCWQGRHGEGLAAAEEAVAIERTLDRPLILGEALGVLGLVRLAREEFAVARSCFEESLETVRPLACPGHTARWLHSLAWATLRAGDVARAADLLQEILPVIRGESESALLAAVLHTVGALELTRGDTWNAETWFKESLQAGCNGYETPRALEGLAVTAARQGHDERALRLAGAASAIRGIRREPDPVWRHCVELATDECRRRLGRSKADNAVTAGCRLAPKGALAYALEDVWNGQGGAGTAGHCLTEREREVARLVADGMTNRQIALRLHVSPRTVDAHLQHIRDKLSVRSRAQVAVWAAAGHLALPKAVGTDPARASTLPD
jgi:predicted ATPase/DNA-binding CsgD family transcriptional regulator